MNKIGIYNVGFLVCSVWWLLCAAGCKQPGDTKWQFAPDMADAPTPKAQFAPLNPPDHAVAMGAFLYAENAIEAEKQISNPYAWVFSSPPHARVFFKQGSELYADFCQHCHGPKGRGEGTMTDVFPRTPDLTVEGYRKRGDGFFFHTITFGGALMPSLGHALSYDERYKIVLYLRQLMAERIVAEEDEQSSEAGAVDTELRGAGSGSDQQDEAAQAAPAREEGSKVLP